ncbi:squalene epoxidase-domain-containing protein [Blastocladiella britannica]|nr:squalene epoxidase-domain-containing protein [Blastocladiella britannica]
MTDLAHDVIVVGAGVAGSALAYALAQDGRKVLLLERDLREPDRIVGELMQPGGCLMLEQLGLGDTLENMDAIDVHGYVILEGNQICNLTYPRIPAEVAPAQMLLQYKESGAPLPLARGKSFHHGRFITNLRKKCIAHPSIEVVQATVNELVIENGRAVRDGGRVAGVVATVKMAPVSTAGSAIAAELKRTDSLSSTSSSSSSSDVDSALAEPAPVAPAETEQKTEDVTTTFRAPLTIVADGCFSKFRRDVLGTQMQAPSHFVGYVLNNCDLPAPNHGHVVLADPSPILLYQIGTHDTRVLVDVPGSKMPSNGSGELTRYMLEHVAPQLPARVQASFISAVVHQRPRIMPNPYLPPRSQGDTQGLVILGDAHNMRHPLTGGGMSVALNDVVLLSGLLSRVNLPDLSDARAVSATLKTWYWRRKPLASVVNILANALYSLFSAGAHPALQRLRRATFDYLSLGGECSAAPVRLLACLSHRPLLLVRHFFQVAAYAAWHVFVREPLWALPRTLWRQTAVMVTATRVIGPLCWYELRGAPRVLAPSVVRPKVE